MIRRSGEGEGVLIEMTVSLFQAATASTLPT